MVSFKSNAKNYRDAESMAAAYLAAYFANSKIKYPLNPFKMLKDEGVEFKICNFNKLEGVYIPAQSQQDISIVGISAKRPITRQRFTAAHELCHHFRDADKQVACPIGKKNASEYFADAFASALLMPMGELKIKVNEYKDINGNVSFDDILKIADYFGVSFEACVRRIAYKIHAVEGDIENKELKKRIRRYHPDKKRKEYGMSYENLYSDLIDNYAEQLKFAPNDYAKNVFENTYIYNDSRMEGLNVAIEEASEIVTDLRNNLQNSQYCSEENEAYLSVAGHYLMYQDIFEVPVRSSLNVYDSFKLNRDLFAYYPHPEFGGNPRQNNVVISGAKFEAVDYHDIFNELAKVDLEIKSFFNDKDGIRPSDYIKHVVRIHHRITVIHPFPEGNGRTARAFMNVQLVRAGLTPIYIKVEEKQRYVEALEKADIEKNYDDLYECIFRVMLRSHVELSKEPI